jgi:hypothetical protein
VQKKSSTYLDCLGTKCQICSFNLRQTTLTGRWEKLHTEDRDDLQIHVVITTHTEDHDNLKIYAIFTKIHTGDRDDL